MSSDPILLNGKMVSDVLEHQYLRSQITTFKSAYNEDPTVAIVMIGENESCKKYTRMKRDAAERLGMRALNIDIPETYTEREITQSITNLNNFDDTHGVMIQHPVFEHFKDLERRFFDLIDPRKDVDGLTSANFSKLALNSNPIAFQPATAKGIITLLDFYGIDLQGSRVVVIGSSPILGLPLSMLMHHRGATVSICNINTDFSYLNGLCLLADVVVGACGVPNLIYPTMLKKDVILVDAGCCPGTEGVFQSKCYERASYYTKPTGGIGPMTIYTLMSQVVQAAKESKRHEIYQG